MKIENFNINDNSTVFIIAELSANHGHSIKIAKETIKAAKDAGANAIKLQTYTADTITINSPDEIFRIKGTMWDGKSLYDLYQEAYTPWEWQPKLKKYAESLGLILFSSPFDKTAVDFLEKMEVPAYKVASFEIVDIPLVRYIASKGKPVIISTGIANYQEIEEAVKACYAEGNDQIALLKCTSAYPAPVEEANLKTIRDMKEKFHTVVGLSDHTIGDTVPIAAVALGAKIVEKHFILDKKIGGPDAAFSMEPEPFREMVQAIRDTEKALGTIKYELSEKLQRNKIFARSLFVVEDIKEGTVFSESNIRSIRPGYGLPPKYYYEILGKKAAKSLKRGMPLTWEMIDKD